MSQIATTMAFHITHRYGEMERNPPLSIFPKLLQELDDRLEDKEHNSVAISHESEWCLSVYWGGYIVFGNLEDGDESHMRSIATGKIIELCGLVAQGKIDEVKSEPWIRGYS